MATGVIESYMSSGSTGYDTKTYEHLKNFYDTQAWIPKNAVLVNLKSFNALDGATQAAVLKVHDPGHFERVLQQRVTHPVTFGR